MAINGINNQSNISSLYNSIFGIGSNSDSGSSYGISDLAMIRNGSYGKLMKAYYATENAGKTEEETKADQTKLVNVKSQAASLNNSLEDLRSKSLYEPAGTDDKGKNTYDQDKITKSVKDFVDKYNSYVKSSSDVDSVSILKKSVSMIGFTAKNTGMLSKIGITIGENNQLTINEDKLKNASVHDVSSLFQGIGSYGDSVQNLARQSYQLANSQAYQRGNGSSYTYSGSYLALGGANGVMDRYL
jgi:hypothetical protein